MTFLYYAETIGKWCTGVHTGETGGINVVHDSYSQAHEDEHLRIGLSEAERLYQHRFSAFLFDSSQNHANVFSSILLQDPQLATAVAIALEELAALLQQPLPRDGRRVVEAGGYTVEQRVQRLAANAHGRVE